MKKILIAVIIILVTNSAICQKSTKERYFQVSFFGVDTLGAQRYGTYFFNTKDSYFPTIEEVQKIVIDDYKLRFTYDSRNISLTITEFKNRQEWIKFNHKIK